MSKPEPPPDIDIAALLQSVHGRSEEALRQDQVDQALKAIESTHRKASLAVRNFEHHGRLEAEANVLAALGALADDSHVPTQTSVPPRTAAEDAPHPDRTQAAVPPHAAAHAVQPEGLGAPSEPTQASAQAPRTPAILSDEPTLPGDARPPMQSAEPTAAALPTVSSTEVTRTFVVGPSSHEASSPASQGRKGPEQKAPAPVPTAKLKPASVYSGRGADVPKQEPTQTKVLRRPKP